MEEETVPSWTTANFAVGELTAVLTSAHTGGSRTTWRIPTPKLLFKT